MSPRPSDSLAIAIAQLNPIVGDIAGNADKARRARAEAARSGADIVALPELFLSGYPPEDLVLKPAFQAACRAKVEELAREPANGGSSRRGRRPVPSISAAYASAFRSAKTSGPNGATTKTWSNASPRPGRS